MVGVFGAGALAGTVAYAALGPRLPRRVVFTAAFLIVGAPKYLGLAVEPPLAIVLVIMALTGFAAGSLNPILGAVDYERVPVALQGRVFGAITAGVYCAMPLGAFGAGWLVALFGLRSSLLFIGGCYLLATLSPLIFPAWRTMDARRGLAQSESDHGTDLKDSAVTTRAHPIPETTG
jgi:MFS family permease